MASHLSPSHCCPSSFLEFLISSLPYFHRINFKLPPLSSSFLLPFHLTNDITSAETKERLLGQTSLVSSLTDQQPHTHSHLLPGSVEEGCPSSCSKLTFNHCPGTQAIHLLRDLMSFIHLYPPSLRFLF